MSINVFYVLCSVSITVPNKIVFSLSSFLKQYYILNTDLTDEFVPDEALVQFWMTSNNFNFVQCNASQFLTSLDMQIVVEPERHLTTGNWYCTLHLNLIYVHAEFCTLMFTWSWWFYLVTGAKYIKGSGNIQSKSVFFNETGNWKLSCWAPLINSTSWVKVPMQFSERLVIHTLICTI